MKRLTIVLYICVSSLAAYSEQLSFQATTYISQCVREKKDASLVCSHHREKQQKLSFALNECSTQEEMKGVCKGGKILFDDRDTLSFAALVKGFVHHLNRGKLYELKIELLRNGGPGVARFTIELDEQGKLLKPVHLQGELYRALANTFYRIELLLDN